MDGWMGVTIWDSHFSFKFSFLLSLLPYDGGDSIAWYFYLFLLRREVSFVPRWTAGLWVDWLDWAGDHSAAISSVGRDKNTKKTMRYIISI